MIFEKLENMGIETDGIISEKQRPTTRKTRVIASNQQVLRIDREIKHNINKDTLEKLVKKIEDKILRANLIILSDYDKGLLTRELIQKTVKLAKKHNVMILADPKSLDFSKYKQVSILTPNKKEAGFATNMDITSEKDLFAAGYKIMDQVKLERLIITCGKDGMVLFDKGCDPYTIESKAQQIFDVSGAGDTAISLLGLGLATGASFKESAMVANAAAGIVVAKVGTATASIDELRRALED